jgi:hypothetical protein
MHADARLAEVPPLYEKDHAAGGVASGERTHVSITSWPGVAYIPTSAISAGDRLGNRETGWARLQAASKLVEWFAECVKLTRSAKAIVPVLAE